MRHVESDMALLNRVLSREIGGKQNILVMNDEARHAYRILREKPDDWDTLDADEREHWLEKRDEATVSVDGLDKINKQRGINFCVDLSAAPCFLGRIGQEHNRRFPWIVSDFGLIDAIESGLAFCGLGLMPNLAPLGGTLRSGRVGPLESPLYSMPLIVLWIPPGLLWLRRFQGVTRYAQANSRLEVPFLAHL
jgi:hypothetical protein